MFMFIVVALVFYSEIMQHKWQSEIRIGFIYSFKLKLIINNVLYMESGYKKPLYECYL